MYNNCEWLEEFTELVESKRDRTKELTTKEIVKTIANNGWFGYFAIKRAVIKAYFNHQRKLGWSVTDSIRDAAVAYDVSESYVKNLVYKYTDIK